VHTCTGSAAALAAAESAWQPGAPGCDTKTASKPAGHVHDVQRVGLRAVKARRRRADAPTSAVLVSIAALCQAFRDAGRPIVHVVRLYAADGSNPELARKDLVSGPTPVLRPGFPGRLLALGLAPEGASNSMTSYFCRARFQELGPNEVALYKLRWGAFYQTRLHDYLLETRTDTVVITGCNFPIAPALRAARLASGIIGWFSLTMPFGHL